jgi:MFS family permease
VLLISFIIFFIAYVGFAFSSDILVMGFLFAGYGLFQGIFRTAGKSFASDFVPPHLRASGIGWYSMVLGLATLTASIVAGQLWDKINHAAVFIYGAGFAFAGIVLLMVLIPNRVGVNQKSEI